MNKLKQLLKILPKILKTIVSLLNFCDERKHHVDLLDILQHQLQQTDDSIMLYAIDSVYLIYSLLSLLTMNAHLKSSFGLMLVALLNIEASANDGIFTENNIPTFLSVALKVAKEEGQKLDQKQYIAYEIIVSSFLLDVLEKEGLNALSSALSQLTRNQIDRLIRKLRALGGHPQLLMFFTGFAGAGKSTCVTVARRYCFEFCIVVSIPWDEDTFLFTATTGSSASLFGGSTIHDAAFLNGNERNISTALLERWKRVRILIIDEISFFNKNKV